MTAAIIRRCPPASPETDDAFIADMARYAEGIFTEADIKTRYRFDDVTWEQFGANEALIEAIEDRKIQRIRNGSSKREKAQRHVVKVPDILDAIVSDTQASPRHRIEAGKTLNQLAEEPADRAPAAADRFIITINLGEDHIERFDKQLKPLANGQPATIEYMPLDKEPSE